MKISSGLSEINLQGILPKFKAEKLFIWPSYNPGSVEKISAPSPHHKPTYAYTKIPTEDQDAVISRLQIQSEYEYTKSGSLNPARNPHAPGILFDALV